MMDTDMLWLRLGDADEYASYDSIADVAKGLIWCGLDGYRILAIPHGVAIPDAGYSGHNHISLFWGDSDAQIARDVSDVEFVELLRLCGAVPA